jgi:tetratricopeptide (TPR) repeat protein
VASDDSIGKLLASDASLDLLSGMIRMLGPTLGPNQRKRAYELAQREETRAQGVRLSEALVAARPDDPHDWATRAMVAELAKDPATVITAASRAIDGGLASADLLARRAGALYKKGQPERALADLDRALQSATDTERVWMQRLRDNLARPVDAIQFVRTHRAAIATRSISARDLLRAWSKVPLLGSDLEAAARREKALAIEMGWTADDAYGVAEFGYDLFQDRAFDVAEPVFRALTLVNGSDAYMWTMLAAVHFKQDRRADAVAEYGIAIDLDPKNVAALTNRGEILLGDRDLDGALADFDAAIALDPLASDSHANRARMLVAAIAEVWPERAARCAEIARGIRLDPDAEAERVDEVAKLRALRGATAGRISIFLSYRRTDSADVTGRIWDRMIAKFGEGGVFKDVDSVPLGVDFARYIAEHVQRCTVLIAVIGRQWLDVTDGNGHRRLDNPADFVRIEIEAALARDIPIVPVLVQGATMPLANELPPSLQPLVLRNGLAVRADPDFHHDMTRLIEGLDEIAAGAPR